MKAIKLLQQQINYRLVLIKALLEVLSLIRAQKFKEAEIKLEKYHAILKPGYLKLFATTYKNEVRLEKY